MGSQSKGLTWGRVLQRKLVLGLTALVVVSGLASAALVVVRESGAASLARQGVAPSPAQRAQMRATQQLARIPKVTHLPPANVGRGAGAHANTPQPPWGTWQPVGTGAITISGQNTESGDITALVADPRTSGASAVLYAGTASGGVWKSVNAGASWTPLTDSAPNLMIDSLAIDPVNPNIIYAGPGYFSPIYTEPSTSYYTNPYTGLLKSTDGGATWTQLDNGYWYQSSILKIFVDPNNDQNLYVLAASYAPATLDSDAPYFAYSTDGGTTFTGSPPLGEDFGNVVSDLAIDAQTNPTTYYLSYVEYGAASTTAGLYRGTLTSGQTPLTNGLPASSSWQCNGGWSCTSIAVAPSNLNAIYVQVAGAGYYSTDGGNSFTAMSGLPASPGPGALVVDPANGQIVYGTNGYVTTAARSPSATWNSINTIVNTPTWNALAAAPGCATAPCPVYFGTSAGMYYSDNATQTPANVTYTSDNTNLAIEKFYSGAAGPHYSSAPLALGDLGANGIVRYTAAGWQWVAESGAPPVTYAVGPQSAVLIDQSNPQVMYSNAYAPAINRFFSKSTDGGTTWVSAATGAFGFPDAPLAMDPTNDQHVIGGGWVYETVNGATSWYDGSQRLATNSFNPSAVAFAPNHGNIAYVAAATGTANDFAVYTTTNAGSGSQNTYTPGGSLPDTITGLAVDAADPTDNTLYVATSDVGFTHTYTSEFSDNQVYMSTDRGAHWTLITGTLPPFDILSMVEYDSGTTAIVVVGTNAGVFFTPDNGKSWYQLLGLPNVAITQLALDAQDTTLAAFTDGRGAWTISIPQGSSPGDTVGIFRPSDTTFSLRNNNTTGFADETVVAGTSKVYPIAGNWFGDGYDRLGYYNSSTATVTLLTNNSNNSNTISFTFGLPGDIPIVGDWTGAGHDGIGVFRPSNGVIYLRESLSTGVADYSMVFGKPGDIPVAGDWNGQGHDTMGIYRPSQGLFYLTNTNCNCIPTANYVVAFGVSGDVPLTGDWAGSGHTGLGVFRVSDGEIYLKNDARTTGYADTYLVYGIANDKPFAGHWV